MIDTLRKIIKPYNLDDVFTPNTVAKLSYIKRKNIDDDLENYLRMPGKQIFIYGHSGGGKTTLLRNKLKSLKRNFILTHCESNTTFEALILQAFDSLEKFYITEKNISTTSQITSELKAEFISINSNIQEANSLKEQRILPIQLSPQKLAKFLGEAKAIWVIEDFHKISSFEKKRIADVIKIFVDAANDYSSVKIVCIGAVGTARELIELDSNLSNRVAELPVPLLTDDQIKEIIIKGTKLLNIHIESELIEKIIYYSNNLASVTHGLCYDICKENGINKEAVWTKKLNEDSFSRAVNSFVRKNSDTFKKIFDKISCQTFGWYILKTFENSEKEFLNINEIYYGIKSNKRPSRQELEDYLNLLTSLEYKEIIRYDISSKKYWISSPLFKTFIKMKMALDKKEQNEVHRRQINKRQKIYSLETEKKELIFDDDFFELFNMHLEKIIHRRISERGSFKILK